MLVSTFPAPMGFVKEMAVILDNLKFKEAQVHQGELIVIPTYKRERDAEGLSRRIAKRFHSTGLVNYEHDEHQDLYFFYIDQDRLGQLIDLRGWPEVTRCDLRVLVDDYWEDEELRVSVTFGCETHN
jgi:hypothetical protein